MKNSKRMTSFQSRVKLGFGLVVLIVLLIIANRFEEENLAEIDQSFISIYKDRLVPATSLFDIQENLYRKRLLMERELLLNPHQKPKPSAFVAACNQKIDSLLEAYKQTYFVKEETDHLRQFEKDFAQYNALEVKMLKKLEQDDRAAAAKIFEEQMATPFDRAVLQLSKLNHLQLEEGKDLVAGEKVAGASIKTLFRLETGLLLLIGVIFYLMVQQTAIAKGGSIDKFHLN